MSYYALVNDFAAELFSMGMLVAGVSLSPTYAGISHLKAYPLQRHGCYLWCYHVEHVAGPQTNKIVVFEI